ncbi:MAG: ATP-dependent Clp protease ATP-binding subunit, partial [Clostridia bacterium]|nr:ATP-dependent Clp protease ATP-binding subunit [Clostridia bacterium]
MEMQKCARCKKRPAVVFITRLENNNSINEGLCLICARELGIKPVEDMLKKMGIDETDIEGLSGEVAGMLEAVSDNSPENADSNVDGGAPA